jgi:DNA-binding response OmpR family regulator
MTEPTTRRVLLIGDDPVLHELLQGRLSETFDVMGETDGHAAALATARRATVDVVLVDADLKDTDPVDLVAGLALICVAPLVALSAAAAPGTPAACTNPPAACRWISATTSATRS